MKSALARDEESLHRLEAISNTSAPILSVYLNLLPHPDETRTIGARLRDQLRPIKAMAESDQLDHAAAMSLRLGIARVSSWNRSWKLIGATAGRSLCATHLTLRKN